MCDFEFKCSDCGCEPSEFGINYHTRCDYSEMTELECIDVYFALLNIERAVSFERERCLKGIQDKHLLDD